MTKAKAVPLDHLRGKKKPVVRSVDIFLDSEAGEAVARAQRTVEEAKERLAESPDDLNLQVRRDDAEAELERLRQEVIDDGAVVAFSFRSIGRKAYQNLIDEHPATEEQQKEAREEGNAIGLSAQLSRLQWNADTFPPALVAAASLEPKITAEEAWEVFHVSEDWNQAELTALFVTARRAQESRDVADLGKLRSGLQPMRS